MRKEGSEVMPGFLAWAPGSRGEANGEGNAAVWVEVSKGQPGENAQLVIEHESLGSGSGRS